jgi:hypothetical protein
MPSIRQPRAESPSRTTPPRAGAALLALLSGCAGHVLHPAEVQPGLSVDVVVGAERPRHAPYQRPDSDPRLQSELGSFAPYRTTNGLLQVAVGYGWRFRHQQGVQLALVAGTLTLPMLDGYWQFLDSVLDVGVGATATVGGRNNLVLPSGYLMVGRGWTLGVDKALRADAGYRYIPGGSSTSPHDTRTSGPMALLGFHWGKIALGLWLDQQWYRQTVFDTHCDDACTRDDTVSSKLSLGAFLRFVTSAPLGPAGSSPRAPSR